MLLVQRHKTLYIFVCVCVFRNNSDMHMILTYALIYYSHKSETKLFRSYQLLNFFNIFRDVDERSIHGRTCKINELVAFLLYYFSQPD